MLPLANNAVVGTDSFSSVVLEDPEVSSRHCQLFESGSGFQLLDLRSTGGTFVNGLRVPPEKAVSLPPGSVIRFGEGGPMALFDDTTILCLRPLVLVREDDHRSWPLESPLVLGRSRTCDVQLDSERDSVASSRHLEVMPAFGKAIISDLGSANGTYVHGGIRVRQYALALGGRVQLGGEGGPWFRVQEGGSAVMSALPPTSSSSGLGQVVDPNQPQPIPDCFRISLSHGDERAQIQVACKPEATFGSFAGLCDFEMICFPRELEDESDAATRGESIGPQHGTFALTEDGVDLLEQGNRTKLNGSLLSDGARETLGEAFDMSLGEDVLLLRGRLFRHPRLPATAPKVGMEAQHPVECMVLERCGDGGTGDGRLYLLLVRQATIGSSDDATIRLGAPGVAPLHGSIFLQNESLWISQATETPIAVDGTPLTPGTALPLRIGSTVYIGATKLVIEAD